MHVLSCPGHVLSPSCALSGGPRHVPDVSPGHVPVLVLVEDFWTQDTETFPTKHINHHAISAMATIATNTTPRKASTATATTNTIIYRNK